MNPKVKVGRQPAPDLGDVQLPLSIAQNVFAALSNHTIDNVGTAAPVVAPYQAIETELVVKSSGIFFVFGWVTICANGGTLAAGDGVVLTPELNGNPITVPDAFTVEGTAAAEGGIAGAPGVTFPFAFLNESGVTKGDLAAYSMAVTFANGKTSGTIAGQGLINMVELPG